MAGCKQLQHGGRKRGAQELADKNAMRGNGYIKNYVVVEELQSGSRRPCPQPSM